jgi:hypothetical protein
MEIEFFCHPSQSANWYQYWRNRRLQWYKDLGLDSDRLRLREHEQDELSHYSCGTADIEYAFPFLPPGEYGELEGIAHRGDFDLRSHSEGKLDPKKRPLEVELDEHGSPKHRGSGKDLTYRDDLTNERFIPHVIEPSAGADRATLAFLCQAYTEIQSSESNGKFESRVVMRLHPRIAPYKAAVLPLVKKDGMPEIAAEIYGALKKKFNVFYDENPPSGNATGDKTKSVPPTASLSIAKHSSIRPSRSATATRWNNGESQSIKSSRKSKNASAESTPRFPNITPKTQRHRLARASTMSFEVALFACFGVSIDGFPGFSYSYSALAVLVLVLENTASSTSTSTITLSTRTIKAKIARLQKP